MNKLTDKETNCWLPEGKECEEIGKLGEVD